MNVVMEQSSCFLSAQQTEVEDGLWFPFLPFPNNILQWKLWGPRGMQALNFGEPIQKLGDGKDWCQSSVKHLFKEFF